MSSPMLLITRSTHACQRVGFQQHLLTASFAECFASGWRFGVGPHSVVCKSIQFRISQNTGIDHTVGTSGSSCGYGNGDDEPDAPHHLQRQTRGITHLWSREPLAMQSREGPAPPVDKSTVSEVSSPSPMLLINRSMHVCPRTASFEYILKSTEWDNLLNTKEWDNSQALR